MPSNLLLSLSHLQGAFGGGVSEKKSLSLVNVCLTANTSFMFLHCVRVLSPASFIYRSKHTRRSRFRWRELRLSRALPIVSVFLTDAIIIINTPPSSGEQAGVTAPAQVCSVSCG